jgi:hypothetical protein
MRETRTNRDLLLAFLVESLKNEVDFSHDTPPPTFEAIDEVVGPTLLRQSLSARIHADLNLVRSLPRTVGCG